MTVNRAEPGRPGGVRRGLVEAEILEHAARLFSENGYAATTLQDIAAELGTSRSSLYHYFSNKDEMLIRLVSGLILSSEAALQRIHDSGERDMTARLRLAIEALLEPILEAPNRFRLLLTVEAQLPADIAVHWRETRRRIVAEIASTIEAGIGEGTFRPVDGEVATFTVLGMCNWVAWWPERQREDRAALQRTIADVALTGLRGPSAAQGAASPQEALRTVRHELDRLESMIAARTL